MIGKIFRTGFALIVFVIFCRQSSAEGENIYFNDYTKEPQLHKYYGDGFPENKEPCDVHEMLPFGIGGNSYVQEFDIGFTKVEPYATWFIGLYGGLRVWIGAGDEGVKNIFLYAPSGYLAQFNKGTYKAGDIYHVKLIYNCGKLTAQCIITDPKSNELIWDSGVKFCESLYPTDIHFAMSYEHGLPYSRAEWDKEKQRIYLYADKFAGKYSLEGWVDNMMIKLE